MVIRHAGSLLKILSKIENTLDKDQAVIIKNPPALNPGDEKDGIPSK